MAPCLPLPFENDRLVKATGCKSWRPGWALAAGSALLVHAALLTFVWQPEKLPPAPHDAAGISLVLVPAARNEAAATPSGPASVVEDMTTTFAARAEVRASATLHVRPLSFPAPHRTAMGGRTNRMVTGKAMQDAPAALETVDDGIEVAGLEARIDRAIQDAAVMPEMARRSHREGRVQVRFSYVDGTVGDVAVTQSGQSRVLDDAALQAVQRAAYPMPPAGLRNRRLSLVVWIDFRLARG